MFKDGWTPGDDLLPFCWMIADRSVSNGLPQGMWKADVINGIISSFLLSTAQLSASVFVKLRATRLLRLLPGRAFLHFPHLVSPKKRRQVAIPRTKHPRTLNTGWIISILSVGLDWVDLWRVINVHVRNHDELDAHLLQLSD